MGPSDSVVVDLTLAVQAMTAAIGKLEDAVLLLAKAPPPSSKRRGAK